MSLFPAGFADTFRVRAQTLIKSANTAPPPWGAMFFGVVALLAPSLVLPHPTAQVARPAGSARHGLVVAGPPPGFVDASHILLRDDDNGEADALLARIQSGEMSFNDAAAEFSACPSRGKKGSS